MGEAINLEQERLEIQEALEERVGEGTEPVDVYDLQTTLAALDRQKATASKQACEFGEEGVKIAQAELKEAKKIHAIDRLHSLLSSSDKLGYYYSSGNELEDRTGIIEFDLINYKKGILRVSYSPESDGILTISPQWTSERGTKKPIRHSISSKEIEMEVGIDELESKIPIVIRRWTRMYEEITTFVQERRKTMTVSGIVDTGNYKVWEDITATPDTAKKPSGVVPVGYRITKQEALDLAGKLMK